MEQQESGIQFFQQLHKEHGFVKAPLPPVFFVGTVEMIGLGEPFQEAPPLLAVFFIGTRKMGKGSFSFS